MIQDAMINTVETLLALEIRSQRIGFAVFDGPTRLLDWGIGTCLHPTCGLHDVVAKRVRRLLFRYRPFAVVMRRDNHYSSQTTARLLISVGAIRREARRCGVKFRLLRTKARKRFFVRLGYNTKHQVAQLIANLFEELSWTVPPKRKPWNSESYHTVIFDAAATGLAAFAEGANREAVRELITTTEALSPGPKMT